MRNLVKKIIKEKNFLSLTANMSVAVFGFLSFMLLTRSLEKNYFGEWVLFITASNFIEMLRFGITRTAIIRFLSGANTENRNKFIGSNWLISLYATILISLLLILVRIIFPVGISQSGFQLFFVWYPLLAFLNLPFNNAISILQADQRFDKILIIRLIQTALFFTFLIINYFYLHTTLFVILIVYLVIQFLTSLICITQGWDGIKHIKKANKKTNKTILDFGKYTTGTLIGSNLLKSSDTFILGLSTFLGTTGVALYSVPLKLTEIIEIPLRSFLATAYPKMSKYSIQGNLKEFKKTYYTYAGAITYLLIPILLISFLFAEDFVVLLGGKEYIHTANIFKIFAVYGIFLPIDRFTGVALDSINKPKKNFYKVLWMSISNIFGDIFVIFFLMKTVIILSLITFISKGAFVFTNLFFASAQFSFYFALEGVAMVTIIMTIVGMLAGYHYLRNEMDIHFRYIFSEGLNFYKDNLVKFLKK